MKKKKLMTSRYICPSCMAVFELVVDDANNGTPYCFNCNSPLVKSRRGKSREE